MSAVPSRNWNDLSELVDVATLSDKEEQCLREIQAIIESHDLTHKLGVALLHKHFDIGEGEILIESNDPTQRTLTTKPYPADKVEPESLITTIWRFDHGIRYACSYCNKNHCQDAPIVARPMLKVVGGSHEGS